MQGSVYKSICSKHSSELEIDLGEKNYTVISEKDIMPLLATFSDVQEIRVKKEKQLQFNYLQIN